MISPLTMLWSFLTKNGKEKPEKINQSTAIPHEPRSNTMAESEKIHMLEVRIEANGDKTITAQKIAAMLNQAKTACEQYLASEYAQSTLLQGLLVVELHENTDLNKLCADIRAICKVEENQLTITIDEKQRFPS